ncbi:hypothetical protein BGAL_0659g00020 [Botrytis galanthina]|uniref:Uncharacterized protein n=1 Tax=Botrytis galanthina TaxID=278940 RepID=A0A4S8QUK7_9HELO|nr:hypothetical protein BGAL_0659g00020 [Botrytis galanthina]
MDFKTIFDKSDGCLAWRFKDSYDSSMFMLFWIHMQNQLKCVRERNNSFNWKSLPPVTRQDIREDALNAFPNLGDFENLWLVDAVCTAIMQNRQSNVKRLSNMKDRRRQDRTSMGRLPRRAPNQNSGLIPGFKGREQQRQRGQGTPNRRSTLPLVELSHLSNAESPRIGQSNVTPSRTDAPPTSSRTLPAEDEPNHAIESGGFDMEDFPDMEVDFDIGELSDTEREDSIAEEPVENGGKCTQKGCNNLRLRKAGRGWRTLCSHCCDSLEEDHDAFDLKVPKVFDRNSRSRGSTQKRKDIQEDALAAADVKRRKSDRVGIRERNRTDTRSRNSNMEASQLQGMEGEL